MNLFGMIQKPFDWTIALWSNADTDPDLLFKTVELFERVHKLVDKLNLHHPLVEGLGFFGQFAKPAIALGKTLDIAEALDDLWNNGSTYLFGRKAAVIHLDAAAVEPIVPAVEPIAPAVDQGAPAVEPMAPAVEPRAVELQFIKRVDEKLNPPPLPRDITRDLWKLAATVAVVAGLALTIGVYLSSFGAVNLGFLAMDVGPVSCLKLVDLLRFGLLSFGAGHKLYEDWTSGCDKSNRNRDVAQDRLVRVDQIFQDVLNRNDFQAADVTKIDEVKAKYRKLLDCEHYQAQCKVIQKSSALLDGSTKVAQFAVTLFDAYYNPIKALTWVIGLDVINNVAGCWKKDFAVEEKTYTKKVKALREELKL